MEITYKTAWRL